MEIERGTMGRLPFAAFGDGKPLLVIAGLTPYTGPGGDRMAHASVGTLAKLPHRRFVLVNRRPELPRGMTMAELAAEHAEAIREGLGGRVDVVGTSTGGSIAQQLAADHPDVVGRLALLSTACRLGPHGKQLQRRVAARIRAGASRQAMAVLVADLVPPGRGQMIAGALTSVVGPAVLRDAQAFDDMATTIEAEDAFDLGRLATIRAPTLIVGGREDRFYAPELFEETARLIPGAQLHLLDDRGHVTALGDKRAQTAIKDFL